jgi:hypothetical protein
VSDKVTEELIKIIDSEVIQPWSTVAVSNLTDSLSKQIQSNFLVDKNQNSNSHEEDQKKYDEIKNKKESELTLDEQVFMQNYGEFKTFAEQINYNSKDHCNAYLQCEMAFYADKEKSDQSDTKPKEKVKQSSDAIRKGKAATVGEMISLAKKNDVNLKVVDDPNYVRTQEEIDSGLEVIYVKRGENGEIGHAYYMDSTGKFVETKSEGFDCYYAAFGKILETKKSIIVLRIETAQQVEAHSKN